MMSLSSSRAPFALAFGLTLTVGLVAPRARAENPAAAEALFAEAKRLGAAGRWAEACPKLEESQRMDPGMGTLFQLASCHERIGKIASAWSEFLEVAASAKSSGQSAREKVARDRAMALERRLPRLTIGVDLPETPGLLVTRDGTPVGRGQWSSPIPVDPGPHRVEASAPGKRAWQQLVRVNEADNIAVRVPAMPNDPNAVANVSPMVNSTSTTQAMLAPAPLPEPVGAEPPEEASTGSGQRIAGATLVGVGVAGLAVGTIFGLMSKSAHDDSDAHCRADDRCDATGVKLRDDAMRDGTISTIGFGAGAAAVVAGAIVWLTAPKSSARTTTVSRVGVTFGAGGAPGAGLHGQF